MNTLTREQYLENPCRAASIPYWKTACIAIPDNMKIVHDSEFDTELLKRYNDEPYFRLQHSMPDVEPVSLPEGYSLQEASVPDFAEHINSCYEDIGITVPEMQRNMLREQYSSELWLAVNNPDYPEGLYRKCGFCGNDVWHILREREQTAFTE